MVRNPVCRHSWGCVDDKENAWLPSCSENLERTMINTERSLMGGSGVPQGPADERFLFTQSSGLPPTPSVSRCNGEGVASAIPALKGCREKRQGREEIAPTQTLTSTSLPTQLTSPRTGRGAVAALQAVIHQACRLGQVFLIRAPSGLLHPGGCLQEGLMRNCLQMLSCKQDIKKGE